MTTIKNVTPEPINLDNQVRFEGVRELAMAVQKQQEKKLDLMVPTPKMIVAPSESKEELAARHDAARRWRTLSPAGRRNNGRPGPAPFELIVNDGEHTFDAHLHALSQLCTWIPVMRKDYWDEMSRTLPGLAAENANQWLREMAATRLCRTLDGTFRAFQSNRFRIIDHWPILGAVLTGLTEASEKGVKYEVREQSLTFDKMRIKVYFPGVAGEVKSGDEVCSYVEISNSEVGTGAFDFRHGVFRMVCSNGMVRESIVKQVHLGAGAGAGASHSVTRVSDSTTEHMNRALIGLTKDAIREVTDQRRFNGMLSSLQTSARLGLHGKPRDVIEVTSKTFGLSTDNDSILTHLIQEGDLTQWGLVNAYTRHAHDVEPNEASELENAAGKIVSLSPTQWQKISCAKVRNTTTKRNALEDHKALLAEMTSVAA